MKEKKLLEALGGVCDEYIAEAAPMAPKPAALPKIRITILAAAVLALLLGLGAYAASQGWHRELAEYLQADAESMSALSGAVDMPELSATDNGVTVTVKQTLADRRGIYVVYEVIAPEDFCFEDDMIWGWESLDHKAAQPGASHTAGGRILEQEGNRRTVLYCLQGREMRDGKLRLHLANLCRFSPDFDYPLIIEGEWILEWDFSFEDSGVLLCENTPADESGEIVIEELSISPLAVYIRVRDAECRQNMRPVISFSDGSVLDLREMKNVPVLHEGECYSIYYLFDRLIDLSDVISVQSGQKTFKLK